MNLLAKFLSRTPASRWSDESYIAPELVVVHMPGLTEALALPLDNALEPALAAVPGSFSTGIDEEGSEASLYLMATDAAALARAVLPILAAHPLAQCADLTVITRVPGSPSESNARRFPVAARDVIEDHLRIVESERPPHFYGATHA